MNQNQHKREACTNNYSDGSKIFPNRDCGCLVDISEQSKPLPCQCMDCFGDNPYHDPHCEYMLDLTREQPDEKNETIQD